MLARYCRFVRYAPLIGVALVGWALAIVGIATLDAGAVFGGVALTTLVIAVGFFRLERGADDKSPTAPPMTTGAGRDRHAAT